jgi:hypothetical protein
MASAKAFWKKPLFFVPLIILLLIIGSVVGLVMPNSQTPARIHETSGDVQVDFGKGFVPAAVDQELDEDDIVKTGADGNVIIVLYEQVIVRLEPDTAISIKELSKRDQGIKQESGTVWSKVARLSGAGTYEVNTPTTTATVRGTSLRTKVPYELIVAEGTVESAMAECTTDACIVLTKQGEKVVMIDGVLTPMPLTEEEKAAIREQFAIELRVLRELRLREVYKNDMVMDYVTKRYQATPQDVADYLLDLDEGRRNEQEIRDNAPFITPNMETVFDYNREIREVILAMQAFA